MELKDSLLRDLIQLREFGYVDREVLGGFEGRLREGALVREENEADHVCAFFVPYRPNEKQVFLGHHIKGDMWMPPGGHIEPGEMAEETVRREFGEELGVELKDGVVRLFNLTMIDIRPKPNRTCRRHWDLWYAVEVGEADNYDFDRGEFHQARWVDLVDVADIMDARRDNYIKAVQSIGEVV